MNQTATQLCWSCRGPTPAGVQCTTCRALLPPAPDLDFFALFGLERAFELEMTTLETRHRTLQRQLHPDFFAQRSPTERRLSLEWTTRLNEGRQTLIDPVARAGYLLARLGWKEQRLPPDPEFLEEVMELREALETVDPQATNALARLSSLKNLATTRLQAEMAQIANLFRTWQQTPDDAICLTIARLVDRMRYHRRYLEELDRLEELALDAH
ncbi:MAG: Fe-S protein assembly co-chaperone HscB [Magnetococcales bacterium]|nr:Fe-S protein assembly co-chaperone HscB [Magnetococcales bacterium]